MILIEITAAREKLIVNFDLQNLFQNHLHGIEDANIHMHIDINTFFLKVLFGINRANYTQQTRWIGKVRHTKTTKPLKKNKAQKEGN